MKPKECFVSLGLEIKGFFCVSLNTRMFFFKFSVLYLFIYDLGLKVVADGKAKR